MMLVDEMPTMTYTEFLEGLQERFENWVNALRYKSPSAQADCKTDISSFVNLYTSAHPEQAYKAHRVRREMEIATFQ